MALKQQGFKTPNGKYYMAWGFSEKNCYDVDVIDADPTAVRWKLELGIRRQLKKVLDDYARWRRLSITKAGRDIFPKTQEGMRVLSKISASLTYCSVGTAKMLILENRESIAATLPVKLNNVWSRALNDILTWCEENGGAEDQ